MKGTARKGRASRDLTPDRERLQAPVTRVNPLTINGDVRHEPNTLGTLLRALHDEVSILKCLSNRTVGRMPRTGLEPVLGGLRRPLQKACVCVSPPRQVSL